MTVMTRRWFAAVLFATALVSLPAPARAEPPDTIADDATRYLALGDSIASGYKALPATNGYPFLDGIPEIEALVPLAAPLIAAFNETVRLVVGQFPANVYLVDVHEAFDGRRHLLLGERPGVSPFETHMTNAGHRAMARAFGDIIAQSR